MEWWLFPKEAVSPFLSACPLPTSLWILPILRSLLSIPSKGVALWLALTNRIQQGAVLVTVWSESLPLKRPHSLCSCHRHLRARLRRQGGERTVESNRSGEKWGTAADSPSPDPRHWVRRAWILLPHQPPSHRAVWWTANPQNYKD